MTNLPKFAQEDEYFDDGLSVAYREPNATQKVLGVAFSDLELVNLCGAFEDCTVSCEEIMWPYDVPNGRQSPAINLSVKGGKYLGYDGAIEVILYLNERHEIEVYIQLVMLDGGQISRNLGTMMFWRMARAASWMDIRKIRLTAAGGRLSKYSLEGGRPWTGYYFWPNLGFEADLNAVDKELFRTAFPYWPPNVADQLTVQSVLTLPEGRTLWRACGTTLRNCIFDTHEESDGMKTLLRKVESIWGHVQ